MPLLLIKTLRSIVLYLKLYFIRNLALSIARGILITLII